MTSKISKFIEDSSIVIIILIIICGIFLRFSALIIMGFPLDFPLNGGGLYYQFSKSILENNFSYPITIPYYTENGIPFAYSPLVFYIIAGFSYITHIDILIFHIYFPIILSILSIIAFYYLSKQFLCEKKLIIFSTFLFAILSSAFSELIVGEGLIESFGVFIYIIGLIYLNKSFTENDFKFTFISGILFGLSLLLSPGGGYAYAISLTVFSVIKNIDLIEKIKKFLIIAILGLLISAPWWLNVINHHGITVLINGFFSRQGINILKLFTKVLFFDNLIYEPFIAAFCLIGFFYCILKKRYLLPALFVFITLAGEITYIIPIFAILLSTLGLFRVILPCLNTIFHNTNWSRLVGIFFIIILSFHALGMCFSHLDAEGQLKWVLDKSNINVEKNDLNAMRWIENNTKISSVFIVVSNDEIWWLNDWFPSLTQRTTLNTVYGSEWTNKYERMINLDDNLNRCNNIDDLMNVTSTYSLNFTHIYFSKSQSRIWCINDLKQSKQYKIVYENDGAIVFESNFSTIV